MPVEAWKTFDTPIGLVRYIDVFEPRAGKPFRPGDAPPPPRYSVELIVDEKAIAKDPKELARWNALRAYCLELGCDRFPVVNGPDNKPIPNTGYKAMVSLKTARWPFRDSAEKAGKTGYDPGTTFFKATLDGTKTPPTVAGPIVGKPIEPRDIYPGCYGRMKVTAIAYDQGGGKGVKLVLKGFQLVRAGTPIMGGGAPVEFENVNEEDADYMANKDGDDAFAGL